MNIGRVYSTTINQPSGITEVLLEKANRENAELKKELKEQCRLLGMGGEREARLIAEQGHYKRALEEISISIENWIDSLVQEPPPDFIHAIKAFADKKLKEI